MKMTDRQLQNRPREKMQKYGAGKLSDLELLMAIIGSGSIYSSYRFRKYSLALLDRLPRELISHASSDCAYDRHYY